MPHITVIDPAVHTPELDAFNRMATTSPVPLTYHLPAMFGMGSLLREGDGSVGVVVMGSASSVNDKLPWQLELGDWLRARMDRGMPTLGLCFGHQLIGSLYGARVDFLFPDQHKLSGFLPTALTANPLWGDARQTEFYASHREVVTACPDALAVIASRPDVPCDGFAHKSLPIWSFQTHPEATPEFLEHRGVAPEPPTKFVPGNNLVDQFLRFAAGRSR